MLTFKKTESNENFNVITKPQVCHAKLMLIRKSHQDAKYAVDKDGNPVEPKELISFVWDCVDGEGNNCHVDTKPCTVSFSDKSKLPEMWNNVVEMASQEDFYNFFYEDGKIKDINAQVMVKVQEKDGKIYNKVSEVISLEDSNAVKPSQLNDWDLRVYGTPCEEYDITPSYDKK